MNGQKSNATPQSPCGFAVSIEILFSIRKTAEQFMGLQVRYKLRVTKTLKRILSWFNLGTFTLLSLQEIRGNELSEFRNPTNHFVQCSNGRIYIWILFYFATLWCIMILLCKVAQREYIVFSKIHISCDGAIKTVS